MLFNSPLFLFFFLPLTWCGFRLWAKINHRFAVAWLVGASLLFYGWWTPAYLILLCGSILFNYTAGVLIQKTVEKPSLQFAILTAGVSANLLLLGYYKYLFPLLHWMEPYGFHIVPTGSSVILPLGISFFTFTQMGYLIDCKAGMTSGRRFLDYALFVTFFPHLIAGPILHHREMMPQFEDEEAWKFDLNRLTVGLSIFFIGLAKKDVFADYFAGLAQYCFDHPTNLDTAHAWAGVLSYSLQLYFDFSGYSEMAIGLAQMFNIRFPANFDSPYKSKSVLEYWQRWHMTLTRYLNLYLYNPIALSVTRYRAAKRLPLGQQGLKTASGFLTMIALPTFITMLLIGIWHGAGIQFVIFGLIQAVYLTVNHLSRLLFHKKNAPEKTGVALWFSTGWKVLVTYLAIVVSQVFFRASSLAEAVMMLEDMVGYRSFQVPTDVHIEPIHYWKLVAAYIFVWSAPNVLQIFAEWNPTLSKPQSPAPPWMQTLQWKPSVAWALAMGVIAGLAMLAISGQSEFLYFRF